MQAGAAAKEEEEKIAAGDNVRAAMCFAATGDYSDARERSMALWGEIAPRETLSGCNSHFVGLRSDGTAVAVGDNGDGQCGVQDWTNIKIPD